MPEVSRFYGIIVRFYYRDHPPNHFHALYGEHEALIEIETGAIYDGHLPRTAYDSSTDGGLFTFKSFATIGTAHGSNSLFCRSHL
jgi:Domain of unknown function (DUF4160)